MTKSNISGKHNGPFVEFMGIGIGTPPYHNGRTSSKMPGINLVEGSHFRTNWPDGTPWHCEYAPRIPDAPALEDKGVEDKGVQLVIFGGYGLASVYLFRDLVTMLQERFPSFGISVIDIPGAGGHPWNMRAAEGNEIEGCISDTLLAVLEESNRDVIVVTFSTAGLFLRSALMKLQEGGFKLQRIIGVSFISLPLGVRRPENEVLAKVVNFIERYGPTRPIAHLGDFIWIKVSTRRPDRRTPPKLNNIPQTEWYPLRATSTIISQGLRVRSSSLLPENLSTVPQLVIHGTRDGKCPPGPVWILVDHFNATGQRLQKLELPHSGHAIPLGKDAALFEQEFVQWCELLLSCRTTERT